MKEIKLTELEKKMLEVFKLSSIERFGDDFYDGEMVKVSAVVHKDLLEEIERLAGENIFIDWKQMSL